MRIVGMACVAVLCLSMAACSSNNQGKIEGKWQATDAPGGLPPGASLVLEFTKDGKMIMTMSQGMRHQELRGTYKLKSGDTVEMNFDQEFAGRKSHSETITIKGDEMTMTDSDGKTGKFKRIK